MTFPLGSAKLLLLHCELWCSGRALLTNTTSAGSHWLGRARPSAMARQFIRRLLSQNTYGGRHIDTDNVSLSLLPFLLSFSVILTHTHTEIHRSDKVRQQRCRKKKQKLAKRSVPVSSSSPVSVFHQRYEGPVRFRSQSGNTFSPKTQDWGSFKG